ncbi:MAG: NUDIX hydrolase [Spirochaetes bacterium]|nr:NUDIX hydrolase [Spirochaetota bacterium]
MNKWEIKADKELFRRRIFSVKDIECYHPDKDITHRFFTISTPDWINVVATTEDDRFIMVRQHRLGTDEITLETPGGLIEEGESPEETVKRELREETGYEAEKIHLLKKLSVNPAIFNNYIYFYYAGNCRRIHDQDLDPAEDIEVLTFSRNEILEMIRNGPISHTIIVTALFLYFLSGWAGLPVEGNPLAGLI